MTNYLVSPIKKAHVYTKASECREIIYQITENTPPIERDGLAMKGDPRPRRSRNLAIPPPVKEANKEDYLAELEELRKAENWIKKYSVSEPENKPISIDNTYNNALLVDQNPSKPNTFLNLILLFMITMFCLIIFVPQQELGYTFLNCFGIVIFLFLQVLMVQSASTARTAQENKDSSTNIVKFTLRWIVVGVIITLTFFILSGKNLPNISFL